jgi:uncharacterized membrane protein
MNNQPTDHISDEFIKKLVKQTPDEKLPEGFTSKVMAAIPVTRAPAEVVEKGPLLWWQWLLIAAALVLAGYIIFFLNVSGQISGIETQPAGFLMNYLNMFSSMVKLFTQGFSGIEVTSRPLIIVAAIAILVFGDRLLKKRMADTAVLLM